MGVQRDEGRQKKAQWVWHLWSQWSLLWVWKKDFSWRSSAVALVQRVEKGQKDQWPVLPPWHLLFKNSPQAFSPMRGVRSAISLPLGRDRREEQPCEDRPHKERISCFGGCEGHFPSQEHPVLPWSCSQAEGSQPGLPNGARTDWTEQELSGKPCRSHVQLPSRGGLSLGRTSVATSTLFWKGTIWSSRKHGTLQLLPTACLWRVCLGLPGNVPALQESLGLRGLVQWEWSTLDTPWVILAGSLSAQRVISWSWALRATLNSQCRCLTSSVIQSHLFASSSFCLLDKKAFYIFVHLGHSSLLPSTQLCKTARNIREEKTDLP